MTDISKFLEDSMRARKSSTKASFQAQMYESDDFMAMVNYILETTKAWADSVGLSGTKKKEDPLLSDEEMVWKKYFSDHTFESPQASRNVADLVKNLTGIDCGRFIRISSKSMKGGFYTRWVSVVPIGNPNEHNYRLNVAHICFREGDTLLRPDGSTGNTMTTDIGSIRVPTVDEISYTLSSIFYNSVALMENVSVTLLSII